MHATVYNKDALYNVQPSCLRTVLRCRFLPCIAAFLSIAKRTHEHEGDTRKVPVSYKDVRLTFLTGFLLH